MSLLSPSSLPSLPTPTTQAPKALKKLSQNSIILLWKTRPELYNNIWKRLKHSLYAPIWQNVPLTSHSYTCCHQQVHPHPSQYTHPEPQVGQQVSRKHFLGVFLKKDEVITSCSGTESLAQLLPGPTASHRAPRPALCPVFFSPSRAAKRGAGDRRQRQEVEQEPGVEDGAGERTDRAAAPREPRLCPPRPRPLPRASGTTPAAERALRQRRLLLFHTKFPASQTADCPSPSEKGKRSCQVHARCD